MKKKYNKIRDIITMHHAILRAFIIMLIIISVLLLELTKNGFWTRIFAFNIGFYCFLEGISGSTFLYTWGEGLFPQMERLQRIVGISLKIIFTIIGIYFMLLSIGNFLKLLVSI